MTIYEFDQITPEDLPNIAYAGLTGHFSISSEIDEFEMYITFRGTQEDYLSLARRALDTYFGGIGIIVEDSDEFPFKARGVAADQLPDWASDLFNKPESIGREDSLAVYTMDQITGRGGGTSPETGQKYSRGIRRNARRFSDFETGESGFV